MCQLIKPGKSGIREILKKTSNFKQFILVK